MAITRASALHTIELPAGARREAEAALDPEARIERARLGLTAKLDELRRREQRVAAAVAPVRHLANPWFRLGVATLLGALVAARRDD